MFHAFFLSIKQYQTASWDLWEASTLHCDGESTVNHDYCHLQFDCRDCIVEFCPLNLFLLVHDVLLLLVLLNLGALLVQPLDLGEGKDVETSR